jgi:VWFA-related protein
MIRRNPILCVVLLCLAFTKAQAQSNGFVLRVEARLVEVYATVFDRNGHFVDGLPAEAFRVLENGEEQKVKNFESEGQAMHCAILLDTTGSMADALPRLKNSVVDFIDALGPEDSVAVYTFTEQLVIEQDFTTDKDAAKRAVLRIRAGGRTALFNALSEAAVAMREQAGKKAMVVFTDGDDNASVLTAQAAVNRAKSDGVPLFTVAEGDALKSPELKKTLSGLAVNTGGASFEVRDQHSMDAVFRQISGELRHMYLLSYRPPATPADGRWRKIEVEVSAVRNGHVRAKEGYIP